MPTNNISYKDLKEIFLKLTYILRGYSLTTDYEDVSSPAQSLIRYAYARSSQPFQEIEDGCSYVWVNYSDDQVDKAMNYVETYNELTEKFDSSISQLRQLTVHWIFYGDSAQDDAFEFRLRLYSDEAKAFLDQYDIKLKVDIPECVLLFEEVNNQWWPRVEISVDYYITTYFSDEKEAYTSVNVYLDTEKKEYEIIKASDI